MHRDALVIWIASVIGLVGVLAYLDMNRRKRNALVHTYYSQAANYPGTLATLVRLAVHETGEMPPCDGIACVRWLLDWRHEDVTRELEGVDERTAVVYDSLGVPVIFECDGSVLTITAGGPDGMHETGDDISASVDMKALRESAALGISGEDRWDTEADTSGGFN